MELFVSVDEARTAIRRGLPEPRQEIVPLEAAYGRILLHEVISKEAIPPFPNSAMDGFAVRSADLADSGGTLRCTGEIAAGAWPANAVREGTCVRIMTGAPMPDGADAVVPVEWTREQGDAVVVDRGISPGRHLRAAGEDMAPGQVVLRAGADVAAGAVAVLATIGQSEVVVGRRPSVAVIATGDELVPHSETPARGQIRNSNGPALAVRVEEAGGRLAGQWVARDNRQSVRAVLAEAKGADVLVFSGGVSMGEYDLVRAVLEENGFEAAFWKVKQRPGKPLVFGTLERRPVFGLPGNPVSSSVCFDQYVRPALRYMQGAARPHRPRYPAQLTADFPKPRGLHVFARAVVTGAEGMLQASPTGSQGSHISTSLVGANALLHLPAEWEAAPAGAMAEVEFL
ncbi:MAG: molybdopterin molybdotransferase MoeA [Rhodothermales bacterium]|nr:molybdopterin molybdotransferase MoeA [Rhodothermales bacterium]MBO6778829.1 molybdopterin molybdotransferase MoeA [Rhodothermales bacterium]